MHVLSFNGLSSINESSLVHALITKDVIIKLTKLLQNDWNVYDESWQTGHSGLYALK